MNIKLTANVLGSTVMLYHVLSIIFDSVNIHTDLI